MAGNENKGTSKGVHFLNLYQSCMWAWYLRYVVGLEPAFQSKFLSFGTAVHAALEEFYKSMRDSLPASADMLIEVGLDSLASLEAKYVSAEDYEADVERLPLMLRKWYDEFALRDAADYDVVDVEREIVFALPLDMQMTVRADAVLRERSTKRIVVLEHKTTSRSVSGMANSVRMSLQPDAQILGIASEMPDVDMSNIVVVPNILYKNRGIISAERPLVISRSKRELADASLHFAGLFVELTQKVAALDDPQYVPELLFARNGGWCGGGMNCDFADVCRQRFVRGCKPPVNFTIKEA